jgi:peptidoglycan/LPS O-acetylase OafA/YrhL
MENDKGMDTQRIYFPELDGLRFLAFLLVLIHHQKPLSKVPYVSILQENGWIGVDLFFALSAFLFTKLLITEYLKTRTISFKKFYLRRVFRIWPIYLFIILFSISFHLISIGPLVHNIRVRIFGLFAFSDNIMTAIYGFNPLRYTEHLWTIAYEEQFYIFIPITILLLVRASFKEKVLSIISIFVLFNLIRLAFIEHNAPHPAIYVLPVTHFESIILGIAIGFGGFDFLLTRLKPLTIGFMGILFFIFVYFLPPLWETSYWLIASYSFVGLSTSLVLFSVTTSNYLKLIFSKKLFVYLGKRSYGLYIYHLFGNGVAAYLISHIPATPLNPLISFMCSLSFTVIAAIISYRIIETPFLKLKKRFEVIISRPI